MTDDDVPEICLEFGVPEPRFACEACGHVWDSEKAALMCATFDDTID